jgi:tetratricopeptide (TPR) repeat protein/O-antigen ligase
MITKFLRNASIFLIFLIPFIPLYVNNDLFFPFITGKAFAFRIIVEIILVCWIVLCLRDKKYAPKFSWLMVAITAFMIITLVADLLGLNPMKSFWSNFERMEGWLTIAHLWAYFMAVTGIFGGTNESGAGEKRIWHRYFNASLIAAGIVSLYGVFQLFGWAEIHQGSSRIDASLGNAAYMAVYMLVHSFLAIYMSFVERARRKIGPSWWYMILAVFFAYILFETGTRGTILGLVGGIMLILAIYAIFGKKQSKESRWGAAGAILVVVLLGVIFYANRSLPFIQGNETLRRLASISINDTKTQARGYIWPMAIKGSFENPKTAVIGIGQENFNYVFNANYNPAMWTQEQWFDRAHNVFLDWLVAGGLVGLGLYLSLFVLALVLFWRSSGLDFIEKSIFTGLLAAYAVHNIFVFDNLISYIAFFTILGFAHTLGATHPIKWMQIKDKGTKEQIENRIIIRDYIYVPITILAFVTIMYFVNIRTIQANTRLIAALTSCSAGGTPSAEAYLKVLEINQYTANQETREQLMSCAGNVIRGDYPATLKSDFYNLAKKANEDQIKDTPNDARGYILGGTFFNNIGDWPNGRPLLEKALELSPQKQSIVFEVATNYMNSGKEKEAAELLRQAYESAPENPSSKGAYLTLLILTGQEKVAQEIFGNEPDLFIDERIVNVYLKLKQYSKAIDIYKKLIAKDPNNIQLYGSLAAIYYTNGQISQSIETLKEIAVKFPDTKAQIDEAIKSIQSGKNPFGGN